MVGRGCDICAIFFSQFVSRSVHVHLRAQQTPVVWELQQNQTQYLLWCDHRKRIYPGTMMWSLIYIKNYLTGRLEGWGDNIQQKLMEGSKVTNSKNINLWRKVNKVMAHQSHLKRMDERSITIICQARLSCRTLPTMWHILVTTQ